MTGRDVQIQVVSIDRAMVVDPGEMVAEATLRKLCDRTLGVDKLAYPFASTFETFVTEIDPEISMSRFRWFLRQITG